MTDVKFRVVTIPCPKCGHLKPESATSQPEGVSIHCACPVEPVDFALEGLENLRAGGVTITPFDPLEDLRVRVEKLSPKPGETVLVFVPGQDDPFVDHPAIQVALVALKDALSPHPGGGGFVLPAGFRVEQHDHAALALKIGLAPVASVASRLRARAATLTYEGGEETARVLREEADRIERGEVGP